jgi:mono/diheme cytochrome c family protein
MATSAFAEHGNIDSGRRLAEIWCGSCHQIGPEASARPTPSLPDLAGLSTTTERSLKSFLKSSHEDMPNMMLTQTQIDDLVAYVMSFKGTK